LLGSGCPQGRDHEPARSATATRGADKPRHVVLVSIDTLRADHLGTYGYERFTSPILDALASEGTVFEEASSTTSWTLPAHVSMLTGLFPAEHGVVSSHFELQGEVPTLASLLARQGYSTAAVVNAIWLKREAFGVTRDFEQYRYIRDADYARRSPSRMVTDQAIEWLREAGEAGLFVLVHYYDVHADYASLPAYERLFVEPYQGPADGTAWQLMQLNFADEHVRRCQRAFDPTFCSFGGEEKPRLLDGSVERPELGARDVRHLEALYDAGIRQLDTELGRLVTFLRDTGLLDETLLIVTSDHGEEFMEHGRVDHFLTTYQESLHVPLILRGPGVPAGLRVGEPVSIVDIVPTVLGLVGGLRGARAPSFDGVDLAPLLTGASPPHLADRLIFGEASGGHQYGEQLKGVYPIYYSARKGRYKGVYDAQSGSLEIYDLASDPGETEDLAQREPALAAELSALLADRHAQITALAPPAEAIELDPNEIEQLRALGYAPD